MTDCPFCSDILLRHVRSGQTYWFCRSCRVEVLETSLQPPSQPTIALHRAMADVSSSSLPLSSQMKR